MDGSQKLPQRILATIARRRAAGLPSPGLTLAVAAWMRYVGGVDESGRPIEVRDPLGADLRTALDAAGEDPERCVRTALGFHAIFGMDLPRDERFVTALTQAYESLEALGARDAAAKLGKVGLGQEGRLTLPHDRGLAIDVGRRPHAWAVDPVPAPIPAIGPALAPALIVGGRRDIAVRHHGAAEITVQRQNRGIVHGRR